MLTFGQRRHGDKGLTTMRVLRIHRRTWGEAKIARDDRADGNHHSDKDTGKTRDTAVPRDRQSPTKTRPALAWRGA